MSAAATGRVRGPTKGEPSVLLERIAPVIQHLRDELPNYPHRIHDHVHDLEQILMVIQQEVPHWNDEHDPPDNDRVVVMEIEARFLHCTGNWIHGHPIRWRELCRD